jgi:hypothetical protein
MDQTKYANGDFLTQSKLDEEVANLVYKKYVNESWWTRCSMLFLYLTMLSLCVAIGVALLQPKLSGSFLGVLGVCAALLVASITSHNRIHDRFRSNNPEEYRTWQSNR